MRRTLTKDLWRFTAQVMLLSLILLSPGITSYIMSNDPAVVKESMWIACYWLAPTLAIYLVNFYLCVPLLWFRRHRGIFCVVNVLLIFVCNIHILYNDTDTLPNFYRAGYSSFLTISLLINLMAIGIAMSIRYVMRQNEKRQKETEAELAWLKNQLNPHFLFNTLNNISSLTQIDADEAQNAILQLSDLLRYVMYDTNRQRVALGDEVDFMQNYIELMQLRCNEMTTVSTHFDVADRKAEIAPLLFVSLIENAFKHGMNNHAPARIDIALEQREGALTFCCDNTNNPKPTRDRSGSGIGLANTRRRMNLLYASRYTWEQTVTADNIYHVKITIQL